MVIQRIQSLFLLIAAVLMALSCCVVPIAHLPLPEGQALPYYIYDLPALFVLGLITAVLYAVDIFLYKNLPLQMQLARISIVLTLVSGAYLGFVWSTLSGVCAYTWPVIMLVAVIVCGILALRGMGKDHKLLRSYDRLR